MKAILISITLAGLLGGQLDAVLAQGIMGGGNSKYSTSASSRDAVPPIVVQFSPAERGKIEMLEEDLTVMSRLLEKNLERGLGEDAVQYKMNIPLLLTGSGRSVRPMYSEGMGALFMVKLNLPLFSPPKDQARKPDPGKDSEWDRTRQEVQNEEESSDLNGDTADSGFDEEKVEGLKTLILQTLKHASNIRSLQPDEFVAVSVFGTNPGSGGFSPAPTSSSSKGSSSSRRKVANANVSVAAGATSAAKDGPNASAAVDPVPAAAVTPAGQNRLGAAELSGPAVVREVYVDTGKRNYARGSVMSLRLKKSDVDAFAKGKIDFDTFKNRMTLNTYFGNGYGVTSLNSWLQTGRPKSARQ